MGTDLRWGIASGSCDWDWTVEELEYYKTDTVSQNNGNVDVNVLKGVKLRSKGRFKKLGGINLNER